MFLLIVNETLQFGIHKRTSLTEYTITVFLCFRRLWRRSCKCRNMWRRGTTWNDKLLFNFKYALFGTYAYMYPQITIYSINSEVYFYYMPHGPQHTRGHEYVQFTWNYCRLLRQINTRIINLLAPEFSLKF